MFKSLVPLHKMRSSSSSSSSNSFSFLHIVCSIIYLLSRIRNADGFSPLIQLPTNVLYRNSSSSSSTALLLNIDDFGAQGNGYTDDTKVYIYILIYTMIPFIFSLYMWKWLHRVNLISRRLWEEECVWKNINVIFLIDESAEFWRCLEGSLFLAIRSHD